MNLSLVRHWQNLVFIVLFSSIFLSYYTGLWHFRAVTLIIGIVCLSWLALHSAARSTYAYISFFALLGLFASISALHNGGISLVVLLIMISQLSIAYCSLKFDAVADVLLAFYYLFLIFTVFLVGAYGFGAAEFDAVFHGVGRNGYSAILFALMIGYCILQTFRVRLIAVTPIVITFFSMLPLYGRSSILATGLVLIAVVHRRLGNRAYIGYIVAAVLIASTARYFGLDEILEYTNFRSGVDSERWGVISEWSISLKSVDLLMGVNLSALNTVINLDGNPHNAFLRLQSFFGAAVVAIFVLIFSSFYYLVMDRMYFFLAIFISIIVKCFFDTIFLIGDLDFLLYPVLFFVLFRNLFFDRIFRHSQLRSAK
jgi:hypothetical protein